MRKGKAGLYAALAAIVAVMIVVVVLALTASPKEAEADGEATLVGTYSVVANLSAPADVVPIGMDAYLTNANNPIEGTGTPTTPVTTANATLYQYSDGTYVLVLDVVNRVFTLQTMGSSGTNATAVATAWASDVLFAQDLAFDDAPTTRISQVTFTLTARQESYTFSGCDLYATALDYYIDGVTLTLTVDFSDVPEYVAEEDDTEESEDTEDADGDATAAPDVNVTIDEQDATDSSESGTNSGGTESEESSTGADVATEADVDADAAEEAEEVDEADVADTADADDDADAAQETEEADAAEEAEEAEESDSVSVASSAHLQTYGDTEGEEGLAGLPGEDKRLEALALSVEAPEGVELGISYSVYVDDYGWLSGADGELAGTSGESLSVTRIVVELTGEDAASYAVWYRVWVDGYGWTGWAYEGQECGTHSSGATVEAVEVVVLPAGESPSGDVVPRVVTSAATCGEDAETALEVETVEEDAIAQAAA